MTTSDNSLVAKIRQKVSECLNHGKIVEAVKFYHEVTLTPLLESKQLVESVQAGNILPINEEEIGQFLKFLEDRDFGGAAASLCVDQRSSGDAIKTTIRIAKMLDVDVTSLELPNSAGLNLADSPHAQAIVSERAQELLRQRIFRRLTQRGLSQEEAERQMSSIDKWFPKGLSNYSEPMSMEGVDPQLAQISSLLLGPVPLADNPSLQPTGGVTTSSPQLSDREKLPLDEQRKVLFRRLGKLAALVYALLTMIGINLIGYSYFAIPQLTPLSMSHDLPLTEQAARITGWSGENLPATTPWFLASSADQFFPVRLEPGLPLAYPDEDWAWEKKIVSINNSAAEMIARLKRCHETLFVLYCLAILIAVFHWLNLDIISGILMVLLGILGIPFLVAQVWRLEFDSPLWLAPLLIPGLIALAASTMDLALIAPSTNRRKELRAFWYGAFAFVLAGLFLSWAIVEGNHLRPGAGLGVFAGAWLMMRHGWRYLRSTD